MKMESTNFRKEIWKDIQDYEGRYQVSNLGRVKSIERLDSIGRHVSEKILKPTLEEWGYYCVILYKESKKRYYQIHRLVAQAFIPNHQNKPQVNHIDGNKINNHVENLEWVTGSENVQHAYNNNLHKIPFGEKNPNATLNWENVK